MRTAGTEAKCARCAKTIKVGAPVEKWKSHWTHVGCTEVKQTPSPSRIAPQIQPSEYIALLIETPEGQARVARIDRRRFAGIRQMGPFKITWFVGPTGQAIITVADTERQQSLTLTGRDASLIAGVLLNSPDTNVLFDFISDFCSDGVKDVLSLV